MLNYNNTVSGGNATVDQNGLVSSKELIIDYRGWGYANSADWYQKLSAGTYTLTFDFVNIASIHSKSIL